MTQPPPLMTLLWRDQHAMFLQMGPAPDLKRSRHLCLYETSIDFFNDYLPGEVYWFLPERGQLQLSPEEWADEGNLPGRG